MPKAKDLTGMRFGRLEVIGLAQEPYISSTGKKTRRWICRCDCGNEITVLANALMSGHKQSCGCWQKESPSIRMEDLTGKRFGKWTVLEKAPLPKPSSNGSKTGWLCRCDCGTERVVLSRSLRSGASRSCGCDTTEKANQRMQQENVLGRYQGTAVSTIKQDRKPNSNNKSGIKGVYWSNTEQKWIAKIGFRGKNITLGRFDKMEDAAMARKIAEDEYFAPVIEKYNAEKREKN